MMGTAGQFRVGRVAGALPLEANYPILRLPESDQPDRSRRQHRSGDHDRARAGPVAFLRPVRNACRLSERPDRPCRQQDPDDRDPLAAGGWPEPGSRARLTDWLGHPQLRQQGRGGDGGAVHGYRGEPVPAPPRGPRQPRRHFTCGGAGFSPGASPLPGTPITPAGTTATPGTDLPDHRQGWCRRERRARQRELHDGDRGPLTGRPRSAKTGPGTRILQGEGSDTGGTEVAEGMPVGPAAAFGAGAVAVDGGDRRLRPGRRRQPRKPHHRIGRAREARRGPPRPCPQVAGGLDTAAGRKAPRPPGGTPAAT